MLYFCDKKNSKVFQKRMIEKMNDSFQINKCHSFEYISY